MKNKAFLATLLLTAASLTFTGCSAANASASHNPAQTASRSDVPDPSKTTAQSADSQSSDTEFFTQRDLDASYDTETAVNINLNSTDITADSSSVTVKSSTATITKEGTYILSGTLSNGSIIIDADKTSKIQLVLNGIKITSENFAPIYVKSADKVFLTLADGSTNTLLNGGSFSQIDDNNVDGVIFAKDDITLNGSGSLTIASPAGHGIVGKDEVTITGGNYTITSAKTCIRANDSVAIADGNFNLNADTDGIHATTTLTIDGGTFNINAVEGMESTLITINDGKINIEASDDGINASNKSSIYTPTIEINGGNIKIVMGAGDTDGIDANGNIVINGGTIDVTGNSAFDFDGTGTINGGTVIVNGEQITELTGQMRGGRGGMGGFQNKENRDMMPGTPGTEDIAPGTAPGMDGNGEMRGPRGRMNKDMENNNSSATPENGAPKAPSL